MAAADNLRLFFILTRYFAYCIAKGVVCLFGFGIVSILAVIFINGFTDAANAVATTVGTKVLQIKQACVLSAVLNFSGVVIACSIHPVVSDTIYKLVNLQVNNQIGCICITASMLTVIIWAVAAWYFGIPTSESHALIAALSGCAIAAQNSFASVSKAEWIRIINGLIISSFIGLGMSYLAEMFRIKRKIQFKTEKLQIAAACLLSFLHGAQDGQKFLAVIRLLYSFSDYIDDNQQKLMVILCAGFMGLGTLIGGKRIIISVGEKIAPLQKMQGFISDCSACLGIAISTLTGLPVSTTHVKTMSVIGIGLVNDTRNLNASLIHDIAIAWLLTFPGCGMLGFVLTKMFL